MKMRMHSFNAARGFVGGARSSAGSVQGGAECFNAARGFVGGARAIVFDTPNGNTGFNAARGFVGGASPSLAALVPLEEKCSFGKSPDF